MELINYKDKTCNRVRPYFDSYLDNELLVETNHEVLRHIATCVECARLLEERTRIKKALKDAVLREELPTALLGNIQQSIRQRRDRSLFAVKLTRWTVAVAALLLLAVAGLFTVRDIALRQLQVKSTGVLESISTEAREILKIGLADHVHCTLELGRWKEMISFQHMKDDIGRTALGPQFIGLVPLMTEKLGPHFKFIQGHRCTINGRDYVHLIATGDNNAILSLIITEKKKDETFTRAGIPTVADASAVSIYRDNQEQLEIAGFETNHFLAFVVSNIDRDGNQRIASNLAPSVYQFLRHIEG
jgi:hypothetical protein